MSAGRRPRGHGPTVAVVGAGAAGTLVALHLTRTAARRSTGLDIVLVDPVDRRAQGVAFGTPDEQHLLNVPASGMTALPEEPGHFAAWRQRDAQELDPDAQTSPYDFAPRRQWARYLDETLEEARHASFGEIGLRHVRQQVVGVRRTSTGVSLRTAAGGEIVADAVVVASGLPAAGSSWAPDSLASSPFFVADPWARGALDVVRRDRTGPADVLLVGTGLTMVDVVFSLTDPGSRPDRVVHATSRNGRLPQVHAPQLQLAAIPDITEWGTSLDEVRTAVERHVAEVRTTAGDWRPALDGLRFRVQELWGRLSDADKERFLAEDAGRWNTVRHRMAPTSAVRLDTLQAEDRLRIGTGRVVGAEPLPTGGLRVELDDGSTRDVGWVVNCTGPQSDLRLLGNPVLDDLLRERGGAALASIDVAGLGVRTENGRLIASDGETDAPLWTLGALRRGELWETTAIPEIRLQAASVARAVLDEVAPLPRRLADGRLVGGRHPIARPRDPLGLPLSTTSEAAAAYNAGLERLMRLQDGAEEQLRLATELDPGFALAHAALAMLGHEAGADADVRASLEAARKAARQRGDDRERSLVDVVGLRVKDVRRTGSDALMHHISLHPRDVLAVSAAVPTIAFSGVTDVQQEAWDLVEGLAPAYGDHWWYISLLAFTRQDQGLFEEAGLLAESALSCEPSSGHAVHAQTHVLYETGQHEVGRVWLDHWVAESGRSASHRAHFSWHAALHELALGDTEAVRRRYYSQLAAPEVTGVRALVDSASLLWRWRVTTAETPPPVAPVLDAIEPGLLERPQTPFMALHAAIAYAAAGDLAGLQALTAHCRRSRDGVLRGTVATLCQAFASVVEERWEDAATLIEDVLPVLARVGGSAAQREVVEETQLIALVNAGHHDRAMRILDERLHRRPSPLDERRRSTPAPAPAAALT
jgi:uncharacterized NAD(P)/FAD-binding protein YdhS